MDSQPKVGGLGVRMVDGKGVFLPESKRGLPTPAVAFYKIFGISRIFPKSKRFGRYHLGYLSEFETNDIEILSGAFMLMRKKALDQVGLLDEDFFMYGEDIDLSYRILKGGYRNVYFPETRIIHYKGESTKKSSVNYVFVFYRAMIIFARKHFSQKNAKLFSLLIHAAIYFRAGLAITARFVKSAFLPIVDAGYILIGLLALTHYWTMANIHFPETSTPYLIAFYMLIWMSSVVLHGGYDQPVKISKFVIGIGISTALILMFYGLLPKEWQFSRLYILIGAFWLLTYYLLSRFILHVALGKRFLINGKKHAHFAVVGSDEEFERVSHLLRLTQPKIEKIHHITTNSEKSTLAIGTIDQLAQIVAIFTIDELIFCAKDTSARDIIYWMTTIQREQMDYKIAQPDSAFLIGSNSIETAGDLYILDINSISQPAKKRQKRLLDFFIALVMLIFSPVFIWMFTNKIQWFKNMISVLFGKKTLVSYSMKTIEKSSVLPHIKTGILSPHQHMGIVDEQLMEKLDLLYAREYSFFTDLTIIMRGWRKLDS